MVSSKSCQAISILITKCSVTFRHGRVPIREHRDLRQDLDRRQGFNTRPRGGPGGGPGLGGFRGGGREGGREGRTAYKRSRFVVLLVVKLLNILIIKMVSFVLLLYIPFSFLSSPFASPNRSRSYSPGGRPRSRSFSRSWSRSRSRSPPREKGDELFRCHFLILIEIGIELSSIDGTDLSFLF